MGHISHPLVPLIAVFTDEIVACSYKVLRSKGSLAQNRALCEHSSSCQLACVNLYVPHRRFQLWTQKTKQHQEKTGGNTQGQMLTEEKKTKKHGFQCRANVDGFLHLYLKNFFLSFLFVLSFEVIYGSYYRSRTVSLSYIFSKDKKKQNTKKYLKIITFQFLELLSKNLCFINKCTSLDRS